MLGSKKFRQRAGGGGGEGMGSRCPALTTSFLLVDDGRGEERARRSNNNSKWAIIGPPAKRWRADDGPILNVV